jgi:hypothetical protein
MADVTTPFGFPYPEDTDLVRDGASDIENLAEGVNDYLTGGYLYAGTRYYESSGTFAKADPLGTGDIGLRAIRVRMVGGGGGGGGVTAPVSPQFNASSGGGGGGYAEAFITDIASLDASEVVTRGSGGAGGADTGGTGANGATSSFSSISATGGAGGEGRTGNTIQRVNSIGGAGGEGSGGDIRIAGQAGTPGIMLSNSSFRNIGGYGGSTVLGSGAAGRGDRQTPGSPAQGYGGGGAGSAAIEAAGEPAKVGGAGSNGIVIVDCFV